MSKDIQNQVNEVASLFRKEVGKRQAVPMPGPDDPDFDRLFDSGDDAETDNPEFNQWFDKGVRCIEGGEWEPGIEAFTRAIKLDPENAAAYDNRARLLYDSGDYEQAVADLLRALHLGPGMSEAFLRLGESLLKSGESEAARLVFELIVDLLTTLWEGERDIIEDRAYAGLARIHLDLGHLDTARQCAEAVLAIDPDAAVGLELLGRIHLAAGEYPEALGHVNRSMGLEKKGPYFNFIKLLRARIHRAGGDEAEAEKDFAAVRRYALKDAGYAYDYALEMLNSDERQWALSLARVATDLDAEFAEAWHMQAVLHNEVAPEQALAAIDRSLALDPEAADDWGLRGGVLHDLKRLEEAAAAYRKALELDPEEVAYRVALGTVLVDQRAFKEALTCYQLAFKLDAESILPYLGRSEIFYELGDFMHALDDAEQALVMDPDSTPGGLLRGMALVALDHLDTAIPVLEKALAKAEGEERMHCLSQLALAELRCGDTESAARHLDEAADLKPDAVFLQSVKSELLLKQKDFTNALKEIHKAIEKEPEDPRYPELEGDILIAGGDGPAAREAYARGLAVSAGRINQQRLREKMAACG
jgi:tetratricopeptide (TPR) repeat protein